MVAGRFRDTLGRDFVVVLGGTGAWGGRCGNGGIEVTFEDGFNVAARLAVMVGSVG